MIGTVSVFSSVDDLVSESSFGGEYGSLSSSFGISSGAGMGKPLAAAIN